MLEGYRGERFPSEILMATATGHPPRMKMAAQLPY